MIMKIRCNSVKIFVTEILREENWFVYFLNCLFTLQIYSVVVDRKNCKAVKKVLRTARQ